MTLLAGIRVHSGTPVGCLLMALHLLNFCVDAPDPAPVSLPENLAYNDFESVWELLLEGGLQLADAVPEHDEPDNEQPGHPSVQKNMGAFLAAEPPAVEERLTLPVTRRSTIPPGRFALPASLTINVATPPPERE